MVLLLNDNTTAPDTFEDTSVEPEVPPPPLVPLPNAALFDTLYPGELELPLHPPPQAATSTAVKANSPRFFQFIACTHHFRC